MKRAMVVWLAESPLPAELAGAKDATVTMPTLRKAAAEFNLLHDAVLAVIRELGPSIERGPAGMPEQEAWQRMKHLASELGEPQV